MRIDLQFARIGRLGMDIETLLMLFGSLRVALGGSFGSPEGARRPLSSIVSSMEARHRRPFLREVGPFRGADYASQPYQSWLGFGLVRLGDSGMRLCVPPGISPKPNLGLTSLGKRD